MPELSDAPSIIDVPGGRVSVGPQGAEYVAICTPACAPETVHREDA